jgi:hypothetical protein
LGFALGRTLAEIEAMPERDIQLYLAYLAKRPLPSRVLELQLAQVSQTVVNMASDKNRYKISDFLLHEPKAIETEIDEKEAARNMAISLGFNPE